ncbi:MAG: asparagine synthase (glutamine-hydrolyzing) [Elusimicrobia bacterium HGW-Elusimicrobia-2]|nr:MAG: asparagine synthase (glutamine-hydrolyzing) [Elusimicrobia bacterium HGW-Elusimicrobia-2]
MCGITGIVNFNGQAVDADVLKKMNDLLLHRGPDDEGHYINTKCKTQNAKLSVGLGMRRLSIIDLETGAQPIFNEDKSIVVVCNGEIYNFQSLREGLIQKGHIFKTKSDTEVLAHLYEEHGTDCLSKLNGMFAFAIWDTNKKFLFLARDRAGKKPLYYTQVGESFYFSSEIKSFLAVPGFEKKVNLKAIHYYLTYQYIPSPMTIFEKVFRIPPASFLTIDSSAKQECKKYWAPDYRNKTKLSYSEAKKNIRDILQDAVKIRMISDVPLGAFLSGGIDSSVVVGIMSSLSSCPVKTFAIGFKEQDFSELKYADAVAKRFKTDHTEFVVEPKDTAILEKLVWHYDQPFADSSALPSYYVANQTRRHVTVALNGDGGDENFGGYLRHLALKQSELIAFPFKLIPNNFFKAMVNLLPEGAGRVNVFKRGKRFLNALKEKPARRNLIWHRIFDNETKFQIYSDEMKAAVIEHDACAYLEKTFDNAPAFDLLDRTLYTDMTTYLPECLMVKMDVASMANSLEARSPFLDYRLVEFAASLPSSWKIRGLKQKRILKDAFEDILPDAIINRGKQGFGIPIDKWFRNEWKEYFIDIVLSGKAASRGYFNIKEIQKLFEEHLSGKRQHGYRLWALLMLELWHRVFIDGDFDFQ